MLGFCSTWGLLGECVPGRCGAAVLKGPGPGGKRGGLVRTGTLVGVWVLQGGNRGVLSAGRGPGRSALAHSEFVKTATGPRARGPMLRLDKGRS